MQPDSRAADPALFCTRCGAVLHPGRGDWYRVAIEAVADPSPPAFTDEELAEDPRPQIERLLARLEGLSEQEAMDQVYRRVTLHLCLPCYRGWIEDPTGRHATGPTV